MDALYGSTKGNIARGTRMYDARRGPSCDYHYTDEIVQQEAAGVGTGAVANFVGNLAYTPVRPGTTVLTDGAQRVVDDGNGALVGNIGAGNNSINYVTGAFDVTFAANVVNGDAVVADYEYNSEGNIGTPEIDIQLTSAPVTARSRKLRARWSIEAQQDFQAYHGINAEVEIVAYMANLISKEINYQVIDHLAAIASAGNVVWDRTPPAGIQWIWHKESFYDSLVACSNLIFSRTQRCQGTWIVASVDCCNVIETLSNFKPIAGGSGDAGIKKIGTLGEFTVYKHPCMACGHFLMGFKGNSFLDTGYIYAPYLAAFTTNTIMLDDMVARKGMMQRVGLKVVNSGMYATGTICQSGGKYTNAANSCGVDDNDTCGTAT